MLRSKWARTLVIASLAGLALSVASSSTAAKGGPSTLRLISVLKHVSADRFKGDNHLYLSPGVYMAAVGGAFEIDAVRGDDGTIALWQVARDSKGVTPVRQITPAAPIRDLGSGLPRFFHVTVTNAAGKVVSSRLLPFCLSGGYGEARVDGSGPDRPQYPYDCGSSLTEATVWGLDQGWASQLALGMRFGAPDGSYTMTITVNPSYVEQFGIPASDATTSLTLAVRTTGGGCKFRPCPPVVGVAADALGSSTRTGASALGEGPRRAAAEAATQNAIGPSADGTPDMRALPAHSLSITHNRRTGRDYLNFAATIWNGGSGPLVVEGFREGDAPLMTAVQDIYRDGQQVSSQTVGRFEFDTRRGHHHWHMEDIAQYDLLDHTGNRVVLSSKQSFCLAPTDAVNLIQAGADWRPDQVGLWSACAGEESIWLREVLPAGWGDTYYQSVAGQAFDITNLPNRHYVVRVTTDPNHNLLETNYDNNVGLLDITLGGKPGHRTVTTG